MQCLLRQDQLAKRRTFSFKQLDGICLSILNSNLGRSSAVRSSSSLIVREASCDRIFSTIWSLPSATASCKPWKVSTHHLLGWFEHRLLARSPRVFRSQIKCRASVKLRLRRDNIYPYIELELGELLQRYSTFENIGVCRLSALRNCLMCANVSRLNWLLDQESLFSPLVWHQLTNLHMTPGGGLSIRSWLTALWYRWRV